MQVNNQSPHLLIKEPSPIKEQSAPMSVERPIINFEPCRSFSKSPTAEGDQIEQLSSRIKDLNCRLEDVRKEKIQLLIETVTSSIELYKAKAVDAPNESELVKLINQLAKEIDSNGRSPFTTAEFLCELAEYCIHNLNRQVAAVVLNTAERVCREHTLNDVTARINNLQKNNNQTIMEIAMALGPVWM